MLSTTLIALALLTVAAAMLEAAVAVVEVVAVAVAVVVGAVVAVVRAVSAGFFWRDLLLLLLPRRPRVAAAPVVYTLRVKAQNPLYAA